METKLHTTWYGYRVDVVVQTPHPDMVIARKRFFNMDYCARIEAEWYAQWAYKDDDRVKAYWRE